MPVGTLVKSSVTKCVGPFEVGAVLSIVEILSAIAPMPAMPFFGYVYRVMYYMYTKIYFQNYLNNTKFTDYQICQFTHAISQIVPTSQPCFRALYSYIML